MANGFIINSKQVIDIWQGGKRIKWGILHNENGNTNPELNIIYEWREKDIYWGFGVKNFNDTDGNGISWSEENNTPIFEINTGDAAEAGIKISSIDTNYRILTGNTQILIDNNEFAELSEDGSYIHFIKSGECNITLQYVYEGTTYVSNTIKVLVTDIIFELSVSN